MPALARPCPQCGKLNAADEKRCFHCGTRLPTAIEREASSLLAAALGSELRATKLLALLNTVPFVLMAVGSGRGRFMQPLASEALRYGALWPAPPWEFQRFLAACFVHFGPFHFLLNMSALFSLGRQLEPRMGAARLFTLYGVSGVLGFVASYFVVAFGSGPSFTAGASGALFGMTGAVVAGAFARRDPTFKQELVNALLGAILIGLVTRVNHAAHLGGFLSGALIGFGFAKEARPWRRDLWFGIAGAVVIVASVASVVLSTRSPIWRAMAEYEFQTRQRR